MKSKPLNRFDVYLLTGISLFFLLFYLVLSYHNRPASHDFQLIAFLKEYGWIGSVKYQYFLWNNRWASCLYFNSLFSLGETFTEYNKYIFLYHFGSIVLFIYAVYSILTNLFERFFSNSPPFAVRVNYAVLFCALLYFITIQAIEVWFWLTVTFYYLQSIIMSCLGFALILKKQNSLYCNVLIALCFIYVGGSVENYSLTLILFLVFCLLLKHNLQNSLTKKLIVALTFLLLSSAFTYTAAGTMSRKHSIEMQIQKSRLDEKQFIEKLPARDFLLTNLNKNLYSVFFQRKYLLFLVLIIPIVFLGYTMRDAKLAPDNFFDKYSPASLLFMTVSFLLVFSAISLGPIFYLFKNSGPLRTWAPVSLFVVIFSCFWGFYLGYKVLLIQRIISPLFYISSFAGIIILGLYIFRQYPVLSTYSTAYDKRIKHLYSLNKNGNTDVCTLEPLPPSGMLVSGDVNNDTEMFRSFYLCKALGLNFKIKTEKNIWAQD